MIGEMLIVADAYTGPSNAVTVYNWTTFIGSFTGHHSKGRTFPHARPSKAVLRL